MKRLFGVNIILKLQNCALLCTGQRVTFKARSMKQVLVICFVFLIATVSASSLSAQTKDSTSVEKEFKNTIKFNISSPLIFGGRYLVFSYERMVGRNQSFSVDVGTFGLPEFLSGDSVQASKSTNISSFHFGVDYRFYLSGENRFPAPHGLYVGPYYSFNYLSRQNTWEFENDQVNGPVNVSLNAHINTIGVEMGYQFVFWKRFDVDIIAIGPGIAHYSFNTSIGGDLTAQQKNQLLTAVVNRLSQVIPGSSNFLNEPHYLERSGTATWAIGYRYIVQIGYRF